MTDTAEFQSGMPQQLQNYWIRGKGALKIRWNTPGAFDRCVRNLTQESEGTIRDVKGTCANLYHEATGRWPGAHREEHNMDIETFDDLDTLVASAEAIGGKMTPWWGPLAPIGRTSDDRRTFPPGTLTFQSMPAPLEWVKERGEGHKGAVTVGTVDSVDEYTDEDGMTWLWGEGRFFPGDIVPEAPRAMALVKEGVAYPSVDLVSYAARFVADPSGQFATQVATNGKVRAATLVSISAFPDLRLGVGDDEDDDGNEGAVHPFDLDPADVQTFAVNATGWSRAPIAPRDASFDADDAVSRIEAWAGVGTDAADPDKLASMFLWVNTDNQPLLGRQGYRLPWGDIIDGKPYLIYHAIYSAAALLSGGHGGLPNIPEADKARLRAVITDIYAKLAKEFNDPSIRASWGETATAAIGEDWCYCGQEFFCAQTFDVIQPGEFGDIEVEEFLGKYTESKHPRDPKGSDEGGEWTDVPGHGPHGQIKVGGKYVYPKRHKKSQKAQKKASSPPAKKTSSDKEQARSAKSQRASGTSVHRRTSKPPAPGSRRAPTRLASGGYIKLDEGETLTGSGRIKPGNADTEVLWASIDTPRGREVRLGTVSPGDEDKWRAADEGDTATLSRFQAQTLHDELEDAEDRAKGAAREVNRLYKTDQDVPSEMWEAIAEGRIATPWQDVRYSIYLTDDEPTSYLTEIYTDDTEETDGAQLDPAGLRKLLAVLAGGTK